MLELLQINMKKEKKEIQKYFRKRAFLLGRRKDDNKKIYLEEGTWDCGWYWGFGYLKVYNKPKTDINELYHFDSLLKDFGLEGLEGHFKSFVLDEKEMWVLADLMSSFYKLKGVAEYYCLGNSNYTNEVKWKKDKKMSARINRDIEKIIRRVEMLLTPEKEKDLEAEEIMEGSDSLEEKAEKLEKI